MRRGHLLKQVNLLDVKSKDIKRRHITRAFTEDGVTKCVCCGRTSLRRDFSRFCRETCTMREEETWYNQRGTHKQQRETILSSCWEPRCKNSGSKETSVGDTVGILRNKGPRESVSERMKKVHEDKTAKSIWDMLRNDQKKTVGVEEVEQVAMCSLL